jgi:hypothetical protein
VVQPEHEILGKSRGVALYGLIKRLCGHTIERGQLYVEHDFLAPYQVDKAFHSGGSGEGFYLGFRRFAHRIDLACLRGPVNNGEAPVILRWHLPGAAATAAL